VTIYRAVGVDPGMTNGVGEVAYDTVADQFVRVLGHDVTDPVELCLWLVNKARNGQTIVVEQYDGSGQQSKYGQETMKREGYYVYRLTEAGYPPVRQTPQQRRAYLDEAERYFPRDEQRHIKDAVAHAIAHTRRRRNQ
jgi:hypothetical protein